MKFPQLHKPLEIRGICFTRFLSVKLDNLIYWLRFKLTPRSVRFDYSFKEMLPGGIGYLSQGGRVVYYGKRGKDSKPGDLFWSELNHSGFVSHF